MTDLYQQLATSRPGGFLFGRLGLPEPTPLRRHEPGQPPLPGPAVLGGAPGGRVGGPAGEVMRSAGVEVVEVREGGEPEDRLGALVFDASGISDSGGLRELYAFFTPLIRRLAPCGRLLVIGTPPRACDRWPEAVAQRALEGFVRAAGKEVRDGATANLVLVAPGAEANAESTLRFLLSARSAYVSGQVVEVGEAEPATPADWERPLDGRVALVTGASRGIGEAIARVLARDGAHPVCLDIPSQGSELAAVANEIGGSAVQLDITAEEAPRSLVEQLGERHGGVDVVVHNAGITRDRTLARMSPEEWGSVLAVNLESQERINGALLEAESLRPGGAIVGVSSVSGIAGNRGQANYATSKAGVIGMAEALAPELARRGCAINAVAPGFIETRMTGAMPLFTREAGRRMNSLVQGGLPVDVAETVAWLASPASTGVNGNVIRICGQSLIGA